MIIRKLICPSSPRGFLFGGGAGSGGQGGGRERAMESKARSTPSRGTVFGVNGVSKTGSTAQDRAIGFTADGGKAGPNYEALRGATREQTQAAVAAAQQSRNPTEAQIAVRNILSADGRGQDAVNRAVEQAQAQTQVRAREAAGVRAQPPIGQGIAGITGTSSFLAGNQGRPAIDLSMRDLSNMALARQYDNPAAVYELQRRAEAGDAQAARDLAKRDPAQMFIANQQFGIDEINRIKDIGADLFDTSGVPLPPTRPSFEPQRISADEILGFPGEESRLSPPVSGGVPLPPTRPAGISTLAPAQVGPPAAQMQTIGPATQAVQGEYYGEDLQQPDIFGTPGGQFTELYGFPDATALGEFQTQAMRGPKALSQVMDFSLLNRGIQALTGKSPSEAALEGGRQSMRDILIAGGKFNPDTGRIEAELPSGRLQMNNLGLVTYSGMPDPNYAGPFANLVNPPEQERGGMQPIVEPMMEEEVVNPCPPGYALVDGVCQPLAGATQPAAPTPAVVPSSFQPTYQPYQPQPLNPFVLSPTGAALGRSV